MTENEDMARAPRGRAAKEAAQAHLSGKDAGDEAATEALDAGAAPDEAEALGEVVEEKVDEATGNAEPASGDADGADGATGDAAAPSADTASEAPAGVDAEAVFARRLDRLSAIVEEAEFESGTALGDMVECTVDLYKHRPSVWSAMSKGEQQDLVKHVESVMKQVLRKVVLVIAQEESDTIEGTLLPAFTVKGEAIEAKLKIESVDLSVLEHAYKLAGHRVVLISADDKRFAGKRRDVPVMADQHAMSFADDAKPAAPREITSAPPAPPADDSDLAGEDDDDTAAETEELAEFGVFDPGSGEWLIDETGGDDGWTDAEADAGCWTEGKATDVARGFPASDGEKPIEVRKLG